MVVPKEDRRWIGGRRRSMTLASAVVDSVLLNTLWGKHLYLSPSLLACLSPSLVQSMPIACILYDSLCLSVNLAPQGRSNPVFWAWVRHRHRAMVSVMFGHYPGNAYTQTAKTEQFFLSRFISEARIDPPCTKNGEIFKNIRFCKFSTKKSWQ